jgi:hypothetical protein
VEKQNKNGRYSFNHINNNIKCEWTKHSILKAEIVKLNLKDKPQLYTVYESHFKLTEVGSQRKVKICHAKW